MKKIFTCVLGVLLTITAFSQTGKGKATVTVLNEQNAPVEGATVELLRSKDTALVKTAITDRSGAAEVENIPPATYRLRITSVGFAPFLSAAIDVKEGETASLPSVHLATKTGDQMQGVTVSARKPFIQRLSDRLVVNVENSVVNAGSAAIDVLERSPGITLDQNDNIVLRGKQGVIIMIDGRPSPMTGRAAM